MICSNFLVRQKWNEVWHTVPFNHNKPDVCPPPQPVYGVGCLSALSVCVWLFHHHASLSVTVLVRGLSPRNRPVYPPVSLSAC